jgi:probable phosphoglycerate mutase
VDGTRIVLVRHGESRAQERGIVGGHKGCAGLSNLGRRQVEALGRRLTRSDELGEVAAIYSSIMPRAVETAGIIAAALGVSQVDQHCDFCEHHPGEGDGLPWEEFERRYPIEDWHPDLRIDPGGETWNEMRDRVARGLDRVIGAHAGDTVVIATHGGVVVHSMVRWLALDAGARRDRAWMNATNSSLTEWRFAANPFVDEALPVELVRFNDHAHLADLT